MYPKILDFRPVTMATFTMTLARICLCPMVRQFSKSSSLFLNFSVYPKWTRDWQLFAFQTKITHIYSAHSGLSIIWNSVELTSNNSPKWNVTEKAIHWRISLMCPTTITKISFYSRFWWTWKPISSRGKRQTANLKNDEKIIHVVIFAVCCHVVLDRSSPRPIGFIGQWKPDRSCQINKYLSKWPEYLMLHTTWPFLFVWADCWKRKWPSGHYNKVWN